LILKITIEENRKILKGCFEMTNEAIIFGIERVEFSINTLCQVALILFNYVKTIDDPISWPFMIKL